MKRANSVHITRNFAIFTGNLYYMGMWEAMHCHACRILWPVRVRKWKGVDVSQEICYDNWKWKEVVEDGFQWRTFD